MDSYGEFNELRQFISFLVDKGFSIIAVGNENFFNDGNIQKSTNKMILRAESQGRPTKDGKQISAAIERIQYHKKI